MRLRLANPVPRLSGPRGPITLPAIIFGLAVLAILPAGGAIRGRIRGTIRDLGRKPLAGVLVRLVSPEGGLIHVTNTDDKGVYAFEELEAGTYDVEASGSGHQKQIKKEILVRPPFRNIVDFTLPPGPVGQDDPVSPVIYQPPSGEPVSRDVTGVFTDKDKHPIADVVVTLTNPVTGVSLRGRSDRAGKLLIPAVPAGTYRVVIFSPGYVTMELKEAVVNRDAGLSLNLSLVEYPLHFDGRVEDLIPEEKPVPPPSGSPAA